MRQPGELRAAIVGFGSIGRRHAENLKKLGMDRLVVVRRLSGRNPAFTPPAGTRVVTSHDEAIAEGLDFAVICSPTRLHVESARPYLAAGIPILMEKPISDEYAGARQLAEEASRRGVPACMAYCMRYHPAYAAARAAIRAGTIGRVLYAKAWFECYLPAWHPWEDYRQSYAARKDLGGGALRTLDHEIDFLNWCLGTPQAVVGSSRRTAALDGDADDHAALLIRYADGADAAVQLSLCRRDRSRGFEFVGEQGTLRYRWEDEKLLAFGADGTSVSVLLDHQGYDINQMYVDLLADFLRILDGDRPCAVQIFKPDFVRSGSAARWNRIPFAPQNSITELSIMVSNEGPLSQLFGLNGRVAIVAGGAGRIGSAVCKGLAAAGAKICILDLALDASTALAAALNADGHEAIAVSADAAQKTELEAALDEISARLGPPAVLVNATQFRGQGFYSSDVCDYPREAWESVLGVNLTGVLLTCQVFGRSMIQHGGGNIVNLSSTYGVVSADPRIYGDSGINSPVSYAASKAAVINLSRYLAIHWRDKNVRVNCLVPGGVYDRQDDGFVREYCARTPLGRMAKADDYVGAVLFMVSQASSYMTGSVVTVDGGWTAW